MACVWSTAIPPVSVVAFLCELVITTDQPNEGHARRIREYGRFQLRQQLLAKVRIRVLIHSYNEDAADLDHNDLFVEMKPIGSPEKFSRSF